MSIHFDSDRPFIAVPLQGETIQDLQIRIGEIIEKPYDMMAFDAGYFSGAINLSQLWNALLIIARDGDHPSVLFSCRKDELPEMYRTDKDYASILRFAVRSSLIDAVQIEGSLDADTLEDVAGLAVDLGIVPIVVIRGEKGAKAADLTVLMEERWDMEAVTFELVVPVETAADIDEIRAAAKAFTEKHKEAHVIVHPVGSAAKDALLKGDTFGASILYATDGAETDELPTSSAVQALLHPED